MTKAELDVVRHNFTEDLRRLPKDLSDLTESIRDVALHGSDVSFSVIQGEEPSETVLFERLTKAHGGSCRKRLSPATLEELDTLQYGIDYLRNERGFALAMRAEIERALSSMSYRGSKEKFGLPDLLESGGRAVNASSRLIWPANEAVNEALSSIPLHGVPIDVFKPDGTIQIGTVESWGRLMTKHKKPGLGIAVATRSGEKIIVDIAAGNYDLKI